MSLIRRLLSDESGMETVEWGVIAAVIVGAVIATAIWFAADVSRFPLWGQIVYVALFIVGPVAWTAVGLAIGSALRRAGVARRSQL